MSSTNKTVRFFPLETEFKSPVGGIRVNEETTFHIKFTRPLSPSEVYLALIKDGEQEVSYEMKECGISPSGEMDYSCTIKVTTPGLYFYHFHIFTDNEKYRVGSDADLTALLGKGQNWQLTVFEDIYASPDWLEGGVMYQIMVDRFFIGGERLKTKKGVQYRDDWGGTPEYKPDAEGKIRNNDFFGGNLRGIIKKLGYLSSLGVTCLYMNPIFEAHSNHKYDTGDYLKVDSDFGTAEDLKELIKKADKKGMRILLDGVFSHTGDDSLYFNKYGNYSSVGAYQSIDSPYYKWYGFRDYPDAYDCWWNIDILPNTQEENKYFDEFINGEHGVLKTWTRLGLGGWRLDVADELPDKFLDRAVQSVKDVRPDAVVIGEVWEDASNKMAYGLRRRYFNGRQLDSVTNYPVKEDILHFIRYADATRLVHTLNVLHNNYPKKAFDSLMNILSTHDTARILSYLGDSGAVDSREKRASARLVNGGEAAALLKMASVIQFTVPGVPCIYYGDEAGLEGFEDPFNRRCYPWDSADKALVKWYKRLGKIRSWERNLFAKGDCKIIESEGGILAYARVNEEDTLYVCVNNSGEDYFFKPDGEECIDLLTGKPFAGNIKNKSAVVLKEKSKTVYLNPPVKA